MNIRKKLALPLAVALLSFGTQGYAGVDITVGDGMGSTYRAFPSLEDNETEPSTINNQSWDLERLVYQHVGSNSLTIIGGFDFLGGNGGIASGDIWIDVDGGNQPGPGGAAGPDAYNLLNSTGGVGGLDFVIHFKNRAAPDSFALSNLNYEIIDLRGFSYNYYDVFYTQNNVAAPFVWVNGGTKIQNETPVAAGLSVVSNSYVTGKNTVQLNSLFSGTTGWQAVNDYSVGSGDTHNILTVDLFTIKNALISPQKLDEARFTIGCGNDLIVGDFSRGNISLPDGGLTVMMIGLGFSALALFRRKE